MIETCYFKGVLIKVFFEKRVWRPIVFEDCIFCFIKNTISLKALEHDQLKTEKRTLKTLFQGKTLWKAILEHQKPL